MVPLDDVQGLILRSYGMDCATIFLLSVQMWPVRGERWGVSPSLRVHSGRRSLRSA